MTRYHHAPQAAPRARRQAHRAGWTRRWGMRLAGVVSVGVLVTSGLGWSAIDHVSTGIDRVDAFDGVSNRPKDDKGLNFLLVGVDKRDDLPPWDRLRLHAGGDSCNCTDTIMLLHLSGDRKRVTVVGIPRDSYVEFPTPPGQSPSGAPAGTEDGKASGGSFPRRGKINSAYAIGGPAMTVSTVEAATGLRIDHYLEVNFRSFVRAVDALGGVQVCSTTPLKDSYSGLDLPRGVSTLDGAGALKYVRARHADAEGDFGRMERQQHFLARMIQQLRSDGVLMNPSKLSAVVDTILASVRADKQLSNEDLVALGTAMRHLTPADSEFVQVPVADSNYRGDPKWGSAVLWDKERAEALFDRIRKDRPLTGRSRHKAKTVPIDPRTIQVQVYNGSGIEGLGTKADRALAKTGFDTTGLPSDLPGPPVKRTVIKYDPRWDRSANSLAAALPDARLVPVPEQGAMMRVTIGSSFRKVHKVRPKSSGLVENSDHAVTGDEVLCP